MMAENKEVKPGFMTTEFWLVVVTNLITVMQSLQGQIDAKWVVFALAGLNGVYAFIRALVKANSDNTKPTE
jgi:hypothetical protein